MTEPTTFEGTWAIVELMGHRRVIGMVTEATIAGTQFLRVDVLDGDTTTTQYYAPSAVYGLHPTTEAVALKAAKSVAPYRPVSPYELAAAPEFPDADQGWRG